MLPKQTRDVAFSFVVASMRYVGLRLVRKAPFLFRMRFKQDFLRRLPPGAKLLDVGCGNDSPGLIKRLRPDVHYTGIDVGDYNQPSSAIDLADEYLICDPREFAERISTLGPFDAIISAHNLEHCNEPYEVVCSMISVLKRGGALYLSFPCEDSVSFPSRVGTLNFYDDPTHQHVISFDRIIGYLGDGGCSIQFASRRYRPLLLFLLGFFSEPKSISSNRVIDGTWAYWGFESLIWAKRVAPGKFDR